MGVSTAFLTPKEAAALLQVSESWIKKRCQDRSLKHYKIAGKLRLLEHDVFLYAKEHMVGGQDAS